MKKLGFTSPGFQEFCALALVLALLWWVANPLAQQPWGLDLRYLPDEANATNLNLRASAWLDSNAALVLTILAVAGYLSMGLARMAIPALPALLAWTALWLTTAKLSFPDLPSPYWTGFAPQGTWENSHLAVLAALVAAALLSRRGWLAAQQPVHAMAYPGFVLFTGLGALWLLDYSAHGRPQWQELGHQHLVMLTIAYATLGLVARFAPLVFAKLARLWARWDRSSTTTHATPWQHLATKWLPWLLCAATTVLIALNTNPRFPSKGAELIRLVMCLMGAWLIYRWSPLPHHVWRISVGTCVVAVIGTVGLVLIHEFGQLMLVSWAANVLCGALVTWGLIRWWEGNDTVRHSNARRVLTTAAATTVGAALASTLAWGGQALLQANVLAPSLQGHKHIAQRLMVIGNPSEGPLSYLSELRWFMHSAPIGGHGLGHVPWCGTVGQFGATWSSCTGVPKEMHADYVLAALVGVWGWPAALFIASALALWCLSLLRPQAMRLGHLDSSGLIQAFGLCFVTVTLMQLLVTCLGNIGLIPLTGVNFPLLGFGGASLLGCAVGMGVLLHQPCLNA